MFRIPLRLSVPSLSPSIRLQRHIHTTPTALIPRTFHLADIGEGIHECEILKWHVQPSAQVGVFDPLCEVQSDKASVEITSPWEGRVLELLVQEGGVVKVGAGLCVVDVEGGEEPTAGRKEGSAGAEQSLVTMSSPEPLAPSAPTPSAAPPTPAPNQPTRRPHPLDPRYPPPSPSTLRPPTATFSPSARTMLLNSLAAAAAGGPVGEVLALPSVRHYAKEQGIDDLSVLGSGTGKGGRVERADVDRYLQLLRSPQPTTTGLGAPPGGAAAAAQKPKERKEEKEDEVVELTRTRWAMYRSMTASLQIPHFGYATQLDLTALHHLLPSLNRSIPTRYLPPTPPPAFPPPIHPYSVYGKLPEPECGDPMEEYGKLTYLPFLVKSLARAMMGWPLFRASLNAASSPSPESNASPGGATRPSLTIRPHADISLALSTPTGLYTPTLFSVDQLSPYEIAGKIARLSRLGRQVPSALGPAEFGRGGTLAVSNIGAIGAGTTASPLLVPGIGLAIVVLGRARWIEEIDPAGGEHGEVRRRLKMDVSWAGDHRVLEGAELAGFVEVWKGWVEDLGRGVGEGR